MNKNFIVPMDDAIRYRRHLHENPELSFEEFETAKYIFNELKKSPNLEVQMLTKNSVVATLTGKKGSGKTIAFRADIDALLIEELADIDFKSKNKGVMHACGHDMHSAILMTSAKVLSQMADEICGKVKFIFQPAEEVPPGGAKELIELGVLDNVDFVFGLHVFPKMKTGSLGWGTGVVSASADIFEINITGNGSHGSTPELSIDPITIGAEIISNINNIVSRNLSAMENGVISFGEFNSGNNYNVIPQTALIKGTVRAIEKETREKLRTRIHEIAEGIAKIYHAKCEVEYIDGYSSITIDDYASEISRKTAIKVAGEDMVFKYTSAMAGEDFSAYTDIVKGAFIVLGAGLEEDGYAYFNHNPMFKIDDKAMENGIKFEVQLVLDMLG